MLLRVYRRLGGQHRPCIVSVREPLDASLAARVRCPVVADADPDAGPLGALATAAEKVDTPLFFAAAGDIVHIDAAFVDSLLEDYRRAIDEGRTPAAVLPTWPDGRTEPLAALYDTAAFLRGARAALQAGRRKVVDALDGLDVVAHPVRREDEERLANVNTQADYARVAGTFSAAL